MGFTLEFKNSVRKISKDVITQKEYGLDPYPKMQKITDPF